MLPFLIVCLEDNAVATSVSEEALDGKCGLPLESKLLTGFLVNNFESLLVLQEEDEIEALDAAVVEPIVLLDFSS